MTGCAAVTCNRVRAFTADRRTRSIWPKKTGTSSTLNLAPRAAKVPERMTASDPSTNHHPKAESFRQGLGKSARNMILENRWTAPLALILGGGIAAWVALAAERQAAAVPLAQHLLRTLLLLLPGLGLLLFRTRGIKQLVTAAAIFVPAATIWMLYDLDTARTASSKFGEVPVPEAFTIMRYLVAAGLLSPLLVVWALQRAGILDRYLLREFVFPFLFCLAAFSSIWLVFDLTDNLPDFRKHSPPWNEILHFYVVQIPHIFTKIAAAAVLIATVYALSRLSRTNQFIAMLGAGRSLTRILLPLFLSGAYISFFYLIFNYQWAPEGEGKKESLLDQFSGDEKTAIATRHIYVNDRDHRTWYIGEIPYSLDSEELRLVDIQEQNAGGRRIRAIQAATATWDSESRRWAFYRAYVTDFSENTDVAPTSVFKQWHHESGWMETPWQLVNQRMEPDYLGVPGLISYVKTSQRDRLKPADAYLTNFHHRWAAPWSCLAILFIAAPLGITFSRRGILGSVASALFIFGAVLFLTEFFLALGKGGYLHPVVAAWMTNAIFLFLGGVFLCLRARNRSVRIPWVGTLRGRPPLPKHNNELNNNHVT